METFLQRRARHIAGLARRLAACGGQEPRDFEALRREVAGELGAGERAPALMAALQLMARDPARAHLEQVIEHVSQFCRDGDRTLALVVIPVALRLNAPEDGMVRLSRASQQGVHQMARLLELATHATTIHFDRNLHTAQDILAVRPSGLTDLAAELARQSVATPGLTGGLSVTAAVNPDWVVRYVVGVATYGPGAFPDLGTPETQSDLEPLRWLAEVAIEYRDPRYWMREIHCDVKCLGFHYARQGILKGEGYTRAYQFSGFLARQVLNPPPHSFMASLDPDRPLVRVLAARPSGGDEFRWRLVGHELAQEAVAVIRAGIREVMPEAAVEVLPIQGYIQRARSLGACWIPDRSSGSMPQQPDRPVPTNCVVIA